MPPIKVCISAATVRPATMMQALIIRTQIQGQLALVVSSTVGMVALSAGIITSRRAKKFGGGRKSNE